MKRISFFVFFLFLFGCEKEEELAFPLVQTGAVTDITPEGAVFNAKILQKGGHEILEYGFVWAAEGISILTDGQKISVREAAPDGTISLFISTTLAPNVKYQVKAYVKDKNHITYGATASFVSLGSGGPSLTDFYPKAGDILDTLTITGKNFSSNKSNNRVLFDDNFSQIIYASRDTLVVQVPELLGKEFTSLSVSVVNNKAVFEESFELYAPKIIEFYPQLADLKESITIVGKNFFRFPPSGNFPLKVKIGSVTGQFLHKSSDTLIVIIPGFLKEEAAELQIINYNGLTTTAENLLKIKAPEITAFYPEYGDLNDSITIVGKNFSQSDNPKTYPYVTFGGREAKVLNFSKDTVIVRVPESLYQETSVLSLRNHNNLITTAEKAFKLNAPLISSFYPELANIKDTLTIVGKNFTILSNPVKPTEVKIGTLTAPVLHLSPNTVIVTVPGGLSEETASLQLRNHNSISSTAEEIFQLYAPQITGFSPKEGSFDAIITVTGANFAAHPASLEAFISSQKAVIQESSDTWLKISVPLDLVGRTNRVSVKMNNLTSVASETFVIAPLILHDFSPKSVETGQEITITGENFHPQAEKNIVTISGHRGLVRQASTTELKVVVPLQEMDVSYPSRNVPFSIEVLDDKKTFNEDVLINDQWFRITDFPGNPDIEYHEEFKDFGSFVINNVVYIGPSPSSSQFWSYEISNKVWKRLTDFPGNTSSGKGFVANDKVYYGTASDWWEYNPATSTWTGKKDVSNEESAVLLGFSFQNKGYIALKKASESFPKLWTYDHVWDNWQQAIDFPEVQAGSYYTEFALANDSEIFLGLREPNDQYQSKMMMYVYSFATASWRQIADYPADGGTTPPLKFILNNELYLRTSHANNFWKYNAGTNSWEAVSTKILTPAETGISFSSNGKGFVGLGYSKAIWEYDPNR